MLLQVLDDIRRVDNHFIIIHQYRNEFLSRNFNQLALVVARNLYFFIIQLLIRKNLSYFFTVRSGLKLVKL